MAVYYPMAAGDIASTPKFARRFRGKLAKETYRCGKGIFFTRSVVKPVAYAVSTVPAELSKGFVYSAVSDVGQQLLGYVSGIGFVRFLYTSIHPGKLKATCRVIYNVAALPITMYSKGIGETFDGIGLSKLEEMWFGSPVYIFDDNRLWAEKNFTLKDAFKAMDEEPE